jgi:hypothetical protein
VSTTKDINNRDDLIDSRDVDARIADLLDVEERDTEEEAELKALEALRDEAQGYSPDWSYGSTLIRDSYFEEYAKELADDIHGKAMREATWPFDYIDWTAAADALKEDYAQVDFSGEAYWVR